MDADACSQPWPPVSTHFCHLSSEHSNQPRVEWPPLGNARENTMAPAPWWASKATKKTPRRPNDGQPSAQKRDSNPRRCPVVGLRLVAAQAPNLDSSIAGKPEPSQSMAFWPNDFTPGQWPRSLLLWPFWLGPRWPAERPQRTKLQNLYCAAIGTLVVPTP